MADSFHIYGSNLPEFEARFFGAIEKRTFEQRTMRYEDVREIMESRPAGDFGEGPADGTAVSPLSLWERARVRARRKHTNKERRFSDNSPRPCPTPKGRGDKFDLHLGMDPKSRTPEPPRRSSAVFVGAHWQFSSC